MTAKSIAKEAAQVSGSKHYEGSPCVVCSSTQRYVSNRNCVPCNQRRASEWITSNPHKQEIYRKKNLSRFYGITSEQYDAMLAAQGGVCMVCGDPPSKSGRWCRLSVDHCHDTGRVRALLCNNCNRSIGLLKDNPVILRAAALYIETHANSARQDPGGAAQTS